MLGIGAIHGVCTVAINTKRCVVEILARDLTRDLTHNLAWIGGHVTLGGDGGVVIGPGNASRDVMVPIPGNQSHYWGVQRHFVPRIHLARNVACLKFSLVTSLVTSRITWRG